MSRLISSAGIKLTRTYLSNPNPFWDGSGDRQIRKLNSIFRNRITNERSKHDIIDEVLSLAHLRTLYAHPPIYIANIGSSGSHWLEAMLSRCTDSIGCGEVYLPKSLISSLQLLTGIERAYFLHALYSLHSGRNSTKLLSGRFINSAHYAKVSRIANLSEGSSTILLIRNPVDIAISRTLRKQEYRNAVAPNLSDLAYLRKNCNIVEKFYNETLSESFDAHVRYEDLTTNPNETILALCNKLHLDTDNDLILSAVAKTDARAVAEATARGEQAPTNLYMGDSTSVATDLLDACRARLHRCAKRIGYDL